LQPGFTSNTPFELTKASAIFQKYINSVLHKHLNNFCSVYLDNVLIYSNESYKKYLEKMNSILQKLGNAGLLEKCEFAVQKTKYLRFIIHAGESITMDPEKVEAIRA
jgi:hypothetical protein